MENVNGTKVLLTGVCRPFGEAYGDAPSVGYELLHKQVTRAQGIFSPRAVHTNFSLDYIAENLDVPTVVLQYPSRAEFIRELKKGYDFVGVSFIMATFHKMKESVELIRRHSPKSKIVLGGYGTMLGEDVLRPYGDFICQEEGVGYFRKLLGVPEMPKPYRHPTMISDLSIFSVRTSRTGKIVAGLGCPNGCDFCCTSHFFKRKHIKLLPTGRDIFGVVERYLESDPDLVFVIFDEDFLLNKQRALEFRECVKQSGRLPSIFVFSSVKAISQYTVEEILEMGIDTIWVGYEGAKSGYAKQQGRPVGDIFTEFREHGITILASMIIGFDYQNQKVVEEELEGLVRLKPGLAQFLIYGPVPGTPFYERIIQEGRMRDAYKCDPEKFYRRADGFTTMIKHPTLSPVEIEGIQKWCFEQDFQRLGPSIYRVIESWLLGYRRLKDSTNPVLRKKADYYACEVRKAYPIFLAGRLFGPNKAIRRWIGELASQAYQELGQPSILERSRSLMALGMAVWTAFTLKFNLFQHPRLTRTAYRFPSQGTALFHLWQNIPRKVSTEGLRIHVHQRSAESSVWMKLEGVLPEDGDGVYHDIQEALRRTKDRLILDLKDLHPTGVEGLHRLREKLASYRDRIRLVRPRLAENHPEVLRMVAAFEAYSE